MREDIVLIVISWIITGVIWGIVASVMVRKGVTVKKQVYVGYSNAELVLYWTLYPIAYAAAYLFIVFQERKQSAKK